MSKTVLQGWEILEATFTTRCSDPTEVTVYILNKETTKIIAEEFFGEWKLEISGLYGQPKDTYSDLSKAEASNILRNHGAPTIKQMDDLFTSIEEEYYSDPYYGHE